MKKFIQKAALGFGMVVAVSALVVFSVAWERVNENCQKFLVGELDIGNSSVAGTWFINGVQVTATAAALNGTGSAASLISETNRAIQAEAVLATNAVAGSRLTGLITQTNISLLTFSGTGTWTTVTNVLKGVSP